MSAVDNDGYRIVASVKVRDSLDRSTLHIDRLANGIVRIVAAIPSKDGIDEHHVYELIPQGNKA